MLPRQQKQSCNCKWWHFNRHSGASVLRDSEVRPRTNSVRSVQSFFVNLSLGSRGRKCSNKKVSRFLLVLSRWFRWWQLQRLKSTTTWTTSSKATVRCHQNVSNAWKTWKERHWVHKVFCYEFMKRKTQERGHKSILSHGQVILQVHERIAVKSGLLILPDASFALDLH